MLIIKVIINNVADSSKLFNLIVQNNFIVFNNDKLLLFSFLF